MKKLFTILGLVSFSFALQAQTVKIAETSPVAAKAEVVDPHAGHNHDKPAAQAIVKAETIAFASAEHDFGKIPQGKPVTYQFEFKNAGSSPLTLDNVQASCGCTTPEWSKDAIASGNSSKITVGYNAAAEGPFSKTITVTYNGGQTKILTIKGEVWKTPATSAPENGSLNNLKK